MKKLILLLCIGTFVCAKPSYPIHSGVGAIYQGPNSETIIRGPDGSVITSEAAGGAVAVDNHNAIAHVAAVPTLAIASVPVPAVAQSAVSHQVIEQSAAAAAASSAAASHTISLSQTPIVVQEQVVAVEPVVAEPVFIAKGVDTALLDGPSGSIRRHGEDAIISGPASTTIREGNVIASIPNTEINAVVVEPARTLVAPQAAVVTAPVVESHGTIVAAQLTNVAEANAHLTDINLINEANYAAQISAANQQQVAAEINAASAVSLANEINSQAAVAEANRAALINANAIHSARLAQSQEAIARANLEQQVLAQANLEAQGLAQANLEAQLTHTAASQIAQANINAAAAAHSQEALAARAGLEAQLIQSVTPTVAIADVNAINSAAIAHSQEAIARATLEAQLVAERNSIASQVATHNVAGLNPIVTQGNQIISDAIISSTPAPVVDVSPVSSIVSSTPGYVIRTSPVQNLIVSPTLKPVSGIIRDRVSVVANPTAIVGPIDTLAGDQVVYQSSSSSSSQAQSHSSSSSQSSAVNVLNSGIGGVAGLVGAPVINTPVGVSSTDYSQWQESFSNRGLSAGESRLASKYHRGIIH